MKLTVGSRLFTNDCGLVVKYLVMNLKPRVVDCIDSIVNDTFKFFSPYILTVDVLVVLFEGEMEFVNKYFRSEIISSRHGHAIESSDPSLTDPSVEPFIGLVLRRGARGVRVHMNYLTTPFIPRYTFDLRALNCCSSCMNILGCCPSLVCKTCETTLCVGCASTHAGRLCTCGDRLPLLKQLRYDDGQWVVIESIHVDIDHRLPVLTPVVYALDSKTLSFLAR